MRGRKPIPTVLAELHGNPRGRGRKARANEPKPVGELMDGPDWFTEAQKAAWAYALRHAPPGLLKRLDRGVLTVWIVAEDLHRQAAIAQSKTGLLIKIPAKPAPPGEPPNVNASLPIQSPYIPIINRQGLIMLKAASELGFTPAARPRAFAAGAMPGGGLHHDDDTTLERFLATDPDEDPIIN